MFAQDINKIAGQLIEWRRDFHQHPELGFEEQRTAGVVAETLRLMDLEVVTGIAKTGVTALLKGGKPGPTAMLRVDMDALPIHETTEVEYASVNPGIMHACGHDGHMAIGLGVAKILTQHKADLLGQILFLFQPAEEGLGGAQMMIDEGVLENPVPDYALGVHLWNTKPVGWLGIAPGARMSAADIIGIEVLGKGGHGAVPHLARDPIVAAAHIITALQTIVSRNIDSEAAAVLSLTEIHGGETFNVIPELVRISGTVRSFDSQIRALILKRLEDVATQVASSLDCEAHVEVTPLTPALVNDPGLTESIDSIARQLFPDAEVDTQERVMGSEDMAIFMEQVPGCYVFVGSANPSQDLDASHHNPNFNFDEQAMPVAVNLLCNALWKLQEK